MVRRFFVGQEVYADELGVFTRGLLRIRQNALIVPMDGGFELVLERISGFRFLPPTSVSYLHLPADGLANIEAVASDLLTGSERPPARASEHIARAILVVSSGVPAVLGLVLLAGILAAVGATLLSVVGITAPLFTSDPGPVWGMTAFAVVFLSIALSWACAWVVSLALGEPLAVSIARRFGRPRQVRPMGTWRGAVSRAGLIGGKLLNVRLRVMQTHGNRRYMVMARTHRSPLSAGVALYPTPVEQMPGLLEAISQVRRCSA
jgi:hypothetical protein